MSYPRIAAICVALSLLVGCQEGPEDAPAYLQRAYEQQAANRNDLAMVEVRNAVKLDPNLLPALELQLELFEEERNIREIFALTETILATDPDHLEANLRRGELLLLSGDNRSSIDFVDRALTIAPDNIKALNLKTAQLIQARNLKQALELSNRILGESKGNAVSFTLAGTLRLLDDDYPGTQQILDQGYAEFPQDMALHMLEIELAKRQSQFDQVPAIYERLVEFYPDNLVIYQSFASYLVQNAEQDRAIQVMRDATAKNPNNTQAKLFLAQLIAGKGDDNAASLIRELVTTGPEAGDLRFLLANVYRDAKQYSDAEEQYQTISENHKDAPIALQARAELARQALAQGNPAEASSLLDSVLLVNSEHPTALLVSAFRDLLDSKPDDAISALNVVLRNEPDNDAALTLMGRAYLAKNFPDLARESFVTAMQANPANPMAAKHLAVIYLQAERYSNLVELLSPFEANEKSDAALLGLLLQGRIYLKDWIGAKRLTNHPVMQETHPTLSAWVEAIAMQDAGSFAQSIMQLRKVTDANPTRSGPARTLVTAYIQNDQSAEAIKFLNSVAAAHPKLAWPEQLLVEVYLEINQADKAVRLLRDAIYRKQAKPYHYGYLARLELKEEGMQQALLTLKDGVAAYPKSFALVLSYASMLEQDGQQARAISQYEAALALDASAEVPANNLAVIYSRSEGTLDRAYELAQRFRNSNQPYFQDTLGWICALRNDFDCALTLLQQAVREVPDQPEFNYHLGEAFLRAKQNENAKRYLERSQELIDDGASFVGSGRVAASLKALADASS